jgi:hypothetical protein
MAAIRSSTDQKSTVQLNDSEELSSMAAHILSQDQILYPYLYYFLANV